MAKYQVIIGRAEEVDIVDVALGVPAKIDTGAYRSAIHASDIRIVEKDGKLLLKFSILGHSNAVIKREIETAEFDEVEVRSSTGVTEMRYEVKLKIKLANKLFTTSFTLADRSKNIFPILIGRTALTHRFMVDVAKNSVKTEPLISTFGVKPTDYEEGMD